ncbi:aldolase/citrate lyase family protein [Leeia oryzae]|uniref:aldolase/citrate lyase family protein n=1 Tax=Leeia oryzae TaxID=356662 RepID=UPI000382EA74|nr:aldolase/citrate lyase family protein [Leeia oryzae]
MGMRDFGQDFRLTLVTKDPLLAAQADQCGVNRIGLDLEKLNKVPRQTGLDTRMSEHAYQDFPALTSAVRRAQLFVRVNPLNPDSGAEIEQVLQHGAQVIMLPFFRTASEVDAFVRLVRGRARVVMLVETASAVVRIREILAVPGIAEIMIGLNDLRLELQVHNHFELLASPLIDMLAAEVRAVGLDFSIGGVGYPDDTSLPVPPDLILAQYPRLGATGAWLSRSFLQHPAVIDDMPQGIGTLRTRLSDWSRQPAAALEAARQSLMAAAQSIRHASRI